MTGACVNRAIVVALLPRMFETLSRLSVGCEELELRNHADRLLEFWREARPHLVFPSHGDAVAAELLPQIYVAIDALLDVQRPNKALLLEAKKYLPSWAANSFEQKQMP